MSHRSPKPKIQIEICRSGSRERTRVVMLRRHVDRARAFHAECLVRPFVVVLTAPPIEDALLRSAVVGGRHRRLRLERAVKPLEPAVLLRLARRDDLDADPEPEKPDRQLGELGGARPREPPPTRGPDPLRQTELPESGVVEADEPPCVPARAS